MSRRADPIALAEQEVVEARAAALAEYRAARARVRRVALSPYVIGGALLGAAALGYLAFGYARSRRRADPGRPDGWTLAFKTGQMVVPLLVALTSAIAALHGPGPGARGAEQ
jgi:hypothetical protein